MTFSSARVLTPIILAAFLVGCGDDPGADLSHGAVAAEPENALPPGAENSGSELTVEELAAESMSAILSDLIKDETSSETQAPALESNTEPGADTVTELDWHALVPAEWAPDKIMEEYNVDELEDDDPRANELMEKLQAAWKEAPVVPELDGKQVKLPGFVVPLEVDGERVGEFLLVPYYGACIHVPPPPANQTVYVQTEKGQEYPGELFDTVWVTGTLKVESSSSDLAEAGYRLEATKIDPYE